MTQEELKQLKSLLEKAREVLPGAVQFYVFEQDGKLVLNGSEVHVTSGTWTDYFLSGDGEIRKEAILVY